MFGLQFKFLTEPQEFGSKCPRIQKGPLAELLYSTTTNLNNQFEQKDSPLLEKKGYSFDHRFFFFLWRETGGARTYCVLTPRFLLLPCMLGRARERKQDKQSPVIFYCKNQMRRTRGISGCTDTVTLTQKNTTEGNSLTRPETALAI